ncbi:MAG: 4Fe-4S cluster-binding domain-containing protein, partial [Oscillospiraceae bacterium]
ARAALHLWEEPCISGENGSGAIFFSGCSLRCVFCQNSSISHENFGKEITKEQLKKIILRLQDEGANNINLVTPTHFSAMLIPVLEEVKPLLNIPVIYNTGGYDSLDAIKALDGLVDVYLPDFKYKSNFLSKKLSGVSNYSKNCILAIENMIEQTGSCKFQENGNIISGTIIRHLVLPGFIENSIAVLEEIAKRFKEKAMVSIMCQYTPAFYSGDIPSLHRTLTQEEYDLIINFACDLGLNGYMQELNSAEAKYTPSFKLEGV